MTGDETNEHSRSGINQEKAMKNVEVLPIGNAPAASNTGKPNQDYRAFLEMAGKGCISGQVSDWQQLKPACAWAYEQLAQLQERNGELIETSTFQHQVILESEKEIADLEKRNAELDRDLDETRDQMKTEKCDYCFDYDQKTDVIEKKLLSDYKKIADLEKRNAELVTKCHQLEFKLQTAEDKLAAVMEQKGRIDSNIEEIKKARSAGSIDKVAYALDQLCIKFLKERDAYREVAQSLNKIAYCGSSLYDDIDVEAQRLLSTKGETGRETP